MTRITAKVASKSEGEVNLENRRLLDVDELDGDDPDSLARDKKEVKKKGIVRKLRRIVEDLGDEDSTIHKTIEGVKNGVSIAQDIAEQYNKVTQWLGLPQVPKPFLKKEEK